MIKVFFLTFFYTFSLLAQHSIDSEGLKLLDTHYSGNYIFYNCEIDLQVRESDQSYQVQIYALDRIRGNELIQNYTVWKSDLKIQQSKSFTLRNKFEVEGVTTLFNAVFTYDKDDENELSSMEFSDYQVPSTFASKRRVVCKNLL